MESEVNRVPCGLSRAFLSQRRQTRALSLVSTHPTPRVLNERCSLAVVAAVTAASLTAAKKSEGCAWVTAELCLCNVLSRPTVMALTGHSTPVYELQ